MKFPRHNCVFTLSMLSPIIFSIVHKGDSRFLRSKEVQIFKKMWGHRSKDRCFQRSKVKRSLISDFWSVWLEVWRGKGKFCLPSSDWSFYIQFLLLLHGRPTQTSPLHDGNLHDNGLRRNSYNSRQIKGREIFLKPSLRFCNSSLQR